MHKYKKDFFFQNGLQTIVTNASCLCIQGAWNGLIKKTRYNLKMRFKLNDNVTTCLYLEANCLCKVETGVDFFFIPVNI